MHRVWTFVGAQQGEFMVTSVHSVRGESLPVTPRLYARNMFVQADATTAYALAGVTSNERYVVREEKRALAALQQPLGRPDAVLGAFIPIRKHDEWWALPQDERRKIFEQDSKHIALGMRALPGVSRRLHHCRDLGVPAEFDFLTWFDFAPEHARAFDDLLGALRATEEWKFVTREVDVRVQRA